MKKWKKFLISLITVFVLAILPAESAILPGTVCVSMLDLFWGKAYFVVEKPREILEVAEQNTEDHRSQKRAEGHLEEQQSEACNGICIRQAFCHQE